MKSAAAKAKCLTTLMAVGGGLLLWHLAHWRALAAPFHLEWWAFVPAYLGANVLAFHIEFREEAHSFTFSELPTVIGFFFAPPWAVLVGRVVGEALFFGVRRRQPLVKLSFNLSMFMLETAVAINVFRLIFNAASPRDPFGWFAVLLAVMAADLIGVLAVYLAIRWHGGEAKIASILGVACVTAVANTSLSIVTVIVLWDTPAGMILLTVVAAVTVLAYRGYATLKQRHTSLHLLYDFTKFVGTSMRAEAAMEAILGEARTLLRAGRAEIILLDPESGRGVRQRSSATPDAGHVPAPEQIELDSSSVWVSVVGDGNPRLLSRTLRAGGDAALREAMGVRDAIVAPVVLEGEVAGAIMVADRLSDVSTFDVQDLRLFETLANHVSVAIENGRLVEQLRREAFERRHESLHDALTGLPNRSLFLQRLECATDSGTGAAAVMLMDLDRFKEVNDTLGHHNGDLLLQQVASRLAHELRPGETVARLGGDEFALLVPGIAVYDEAVDRARRIIAALRPGFVIDGLSLDVGASIGIAFAPEHGRDATTLLQRADVAMYQAKADTDQVSVYSVEGDTYSPRRLALVTELRQAIENGDLLVYHQPKARLSDGQVVGTEALVRWRHPTHGVLPPDEFIPQAEHTGVISELTTYVLTSALRQCASWRQMGHDVGVAVNLAVRCLLDSSLPDLVGELVAETGLPPEHLTLEITESSIMADPTRTISVLNRLAGIGVKLSIDDFGTGYSSLAYLQRLSVHEIKIDKSFVFRMAVDASDAMIVQSIVDLGHNLGLRVVAEGVEDQISWDRLRSISCDVAQGYHLSKPVPASEVTRWLDERRAMYGVPGMAPDDLVGAQPGSRPVGARVPDGDWFTQVGTKGSWPHLPMSSMVPGGGDPRDGT